MSTTPVKYAAGSIAAASAMKAMNATCQPWPAISVWASGAAKNVPIDPTAAVMPRTMLREAGDTARAQAVMPRFEAEHESAMPISTPAPMVKLSRPCEKAIVAMPARNRSEPPIITGREP